MTILITGANRGIGRALLDAYRTDGAHVIGTTRGAAPGPDWHQLDVTDPTSQSALGTSLGDQPLDLLICNAGVYLDKGEALETGYAAALWADSFATNVTGVFLTIQTCLPALNKGTNPRVAILSSQMASHTRAPGGSYIYRASKAAALNLGRNLATDLKPRGIAVGVYHPGWVRTDMGGDMGDISTDEAVDGLTERFKTLTLENTGCFQTWDGRDHAY